MKFTKAQNIVLTEIYRRLNYFHKGDLKTTLLIPAYPSEISVIKKYGLIKPYKSEVQRVRNWYNLTDKGKAFFSHYIEEISEEKNSLYFTYGYFKIFNTDYL